VRFRRRRGGTIEADLSEVEAVVLASAARDLAALLGQDEDVEPEDDPLAAAVGLPSGDVRRPDDPALARLLPDAYRADAGQGEDAAAAAAEFRRYTEADLRAGKRAHAAVVVEALAALPDGGRLRLDRGQADAWLGCLNDLRLVLGTRLEVTEDTALEALPDDDPRAPALQVYGWLGWLQESLLECLDPRSR
jgi:hypothetical protein